MKLAILFWCYKKVEVCVSRLQLLRHFNPQTPIYVLFGGPPTEARKFESEFLPYIEDFYFYPEQKDSFWKYWNGDMLISQWFKERGHQLEWNSLVIAQWDMLIFDAVERIFDNVHEQQLLLSHARPAAEDGFREWFLSEATMPPAHENLAEYTRFLAEHHLDDADVWWSAFIIAVFPRAFLERFSVRQDPEIGFLEYSIPTLAKLWGFDINMNHPYSGYRADRHRYYDMVSAGKQQIPRRYILLHLLDPWGLRIFHPCEQILYTEKLSPALPAWLNFLRCDAWDYAEIFGESMRSLTRHAIAGYDLAFPDPVTTQPAICLVMVVHNAANVLTRVLDSAAPHISSWVIVDTGSDDETQNLITSYMADRGIRGELYRRSAGSLGSNQEAALALAQDRGDYLWLLEVGDTLVGTPHFTQLGADIYWLRCRDDSGRTFWRAQLFRDGVRMRYQSVEDYVASDDDEICAGARLDGCYHIATGPTNVNSLGPEQKLARDRELLLVAVDRNPADPRSVFELAQRYFDLGDFTNAHTWYSRRVELGGNPEEVYYAKYQVAKSMEKLNAPWPKVQDALLCAWESRPNRAEAPHAIASWYRIHQRYRLGYLFAQRAAEIPFPEHDRFRVHQEIYAWRAADEQAVCASWIGRHPEAFTLWRRLLTRPDLPDHERQRIATNRDVCVSTMLRAATRYPDQLVQQLVANPRSGEVVCSLAAGPDRSEIEHTLNSFLHCCTDHERIGRFLVWDTGLSEQDRAALVERYGFLEFYQLDPESQSSPVSAQLPAQIHERFWLRLGEGWRFFAPEDLITRLTAVLEAEPQVAQVAINLSDATTLTHISAPENVVRRGQHTGRYLLTDTVAAGPALFDTTRLGRINDPHTASLDEVLCIHSSALDDD